MRNTLTLLLAGLLAAPLACAAPASGETTLANGLRVIVQEDHRSPVVTTQVWYRVGSVDEPAGRTGISHVLEHMMFKGTREVPAGEFARIVSRFGGEHNAFTSRYYTGYYQDYDASRLTVALALEADRMRQLVIDDGEFRKEIEVVREERRMRVEDSPVSVAMEKFRAVAMPGNPAGNPVIGWATDLDAITPDDLREWYDTWYAPNNATLVVVGDVRMQDVFHLAEKYFGPLKSRRVPAALAPRTAPQPGLRRMKLQVPVRVPTLVMAWNMPSLATAGEPRDAWALTVMASILDGGRSSRFSRDLVRKRKLASSMGASYDLLDRGDGVFQVSAVPAGEHTLADLESAVRESIKALRDKPPTDDELARVKAQVVSALVYQQDSLSGQAGLIGSLATQGHDWRLKDTWADRVMEVTGADVQRVARRYFGDDTLAVAEILPEAKKP
jgi:zinc protease